jgi:serine/threonine-protein kinase
MTPDCWQQINDIFLKLVAVPLDQRQTLLDVLCGSDDALRENVKRLLAHDESGPSFESTPLIPDDGARSASVDFVVGRRFGPYAARRLIGRGGMGSVYLADRFADYQQQVAIKVIQRTAASPELLRRFRAEVQFLADMGKHPNIAALLDAGQSDDEAPYFVMEYVDGQRIDRYCDEKRLTIGQRLELFRTVCSAVQFAHQHTVIHRDLKPSNILVRADGVPKLIDFGIAKLMLTEPASDTTRTELRVLTPDYASPEQLLGQNITTASDVYSLGVVLYELLTGHRPYRPRGQDLLALAKTVAEREPERPSTVIDRTENFDAADGPATPITPDSVSQCRDASRQKLKRQLCGDLDNIVLMALRKEPDRRYASVEQLSADIGRHLSGHPVIARPDTFRYRAGKFLSRSWPAVTAVAAMVLLLIAGVIGTSWQWLRADRMAEQARQEAATAQAVNEFFVLDMISSANPTRRPRNVTLNEILEQAAKRIGTRFQDQPVLEATIRHTLGDALLHLGNYQSAEEQLREALAIRERILGGNDRATLNTMVLLGDALDCLERFDEAERLFIMACQRMTAALGGDDADTLAAQARLGETLQTLGKHDEAQPLLRRVIDGQRRVLGPDHPRRGTAINSLGASYLAQKKFPEAEIAFREFIALNERSPDSDATRLTIGLNQLGSLYFKQAKYDQAEPLFRRLIEVAQQRLPADHPDQARFHGNFGICLARLNRLEEAEPHMVKAYELFQRTLGDDHSDTVWYLTNLYGFYYACGQLDKAEPLHVRQIQTRLRAGKLNDDDARELQKTVDRFVSKVTEMGQPERVSRLYQSLTHYVEAELADDHRAKSQALGQLGVMLSRAGQHESAERLLKASYARLAKTSGPDHADIRWLIQKLVSVYDAWQKPNRAAEWQAKLHDR